MSDLVAGRYPVAEEEWLLDGQPIPPYRRSVNRRDITSTSAKTLATATMVVVAVPVQAGDIFNFVSFIAASAPTATVSHSWAAVYSGVGTGAALLAQSADVTTGYVANANKLALTAAASDVAQPGTPQGPAGGPGSWSLVVAGPAVYGVALYNVTSGTGAILDGMTGGTVAGEVVVTGQVPMVSTGTLATTATAPAVLPTMTAVAGGVPYVLLSKQ